MHYTITLDSHLSTPFVFIHESSIRVATISSDGSSQQVLRLFPRSASANSTTFRLPAEGTVNPNRYREDDAGVSHFDDDDEPNMPEIAREIVGSVKEPHPKCLVISLGCNKIVSLVEDIDPKVLVKEVPDWAPIVFSPAVESVEAETDSPPNEVLQTEASRAIHAFCIAPVRLPSIGIDNAFTHAYIVCGKKTWKRWYSQDSANSVYGLVPLAMSDRREALAWADRARAAGIANTKVFAPRESSDYATTQSMGHHFQQAFATDDRQLGGFICALLFLPRLGIAVNAMSILGVFAPNSKRLVRETVRRLKVQHVVLCVTSNGLDLEELELALPNARLNLMIPILPLIDNDYRLALLLSELPSHPDITLIKVQLAVPLSM